MKKLLHRLIDSIYSPIEQLLRRELAGLRINFENFGPQQKNLRLPESQTQIE